MKNRVKTFIYVKSSTKIISKLERLCSEVIVIENYKEYKAQVSNMGLFNYHVFIVDIEYLLDKKVIGNTKIKKDLLNTQKLFTVAYGKAIKKVDKSKLYGLEINAIIDEEYDYQDKMIDHIMYRAALEMQTHKNNFIKAFLHCNDLEYEAKRMFYFFDTLTHTYPIDYKDLINIKLTFSALYIACMNNTLVKTHKTLEIMFRSHSISDLYCSFSYPKTFNQAVISILLSLHSYKDNDKHKNMINMQSIDNTLVNSIAAFYTQKKTFLLSYLDINFFWGELEEYFLKNVSQEHEDIIDAYMFSIYFICTHILDMNGYASVFTQIPADDSDCLITLNLYHQDRKAIEACISQIHNNEHIPDLYTNKNIHLEDHDNQIELKLNLDPLVADVIDVKTDTLIINKDNINTMHYKDDEKISAREFMEQNKINPYLLDDLEDTQKEMKSLLFFESEISDKMLSLLSNTLDSYGKVLRNTMEFNDIAYSLELLSNVFKSISVDDIDDKKKSTLHFYIEGLINDLENWKNYIFIEQNSSDIHYLDASLLENCSEIEKFITTDSESEEVEDDDDLEFF